MWNLEVVRNSITSCDAVLRRKIIAGLSCPNVFHALQVHGY